MPAAARITDTESCPHSPSSPIMTGAGTVFIEGRQAARVGDRLECPGGPTQIESGAPTVRIEGQKAARIGDTTCHQGRITIGAARTFIGNGGGSRTTTMDLAHRGGAPFVLA